MDAIRSWQTANSTTVLFDDAIAVPGYGFVHRDGVMREHMEVVEVIAPTDLAIYTAAFIARVRRLTTRLEGLGLVIRGSEVAIPGRKRPKFMTRLSQEHVECLEAASDHELRAAFTAATRHEAPLPEVQTRTERLVATYQPPSTAAGIADRVDNDLLVGKLV